MKTDYECFSVTIEDAVAHIRLSRPEKRNAMAPSFWDDLPAAVRDIDDHARARVIVISAETLPDRPVFSAGIDLSMFSAIGGKGDKNAADYGPTFYTNVLRLQDSLSALEQARIPVIAAIHGACIGGAVDLITACDIRYASQDSFVTIYEIVVGMTADLGTFPRILNHLPEGVVRELAYTGRRMGADECERHGLFNATFETEAALLDHAMSVAHDIASRPPMAIFGCKRIITYARDHTTQDTLDNIAVWNMSMLIPAEMMEAMAAKGEKRAGVFKDLPARRKD